MGEGSPRTSFCPITVDLLSKTSSPFLGHPHPFQPSRGFLDSFMFASSVMFVHFLFDFHCFPAWTMCLSYRHLVLLLWQVCNDRRF